MSLFRPDLSWFNHRNIKPALQRKSDKWQGMVWQKGEAENCEA